MDVFRFDGRSSSNTSASRPETRPVRTGGESRRGHRSYAVRMSDPPLSSREIRVGARPVGMVQSEPPIGLGHCRNLLKGVGVGVAVSGIAVLVVGGTPGEWLSGLLWVLLALVVVCAVGADWAGRHRGGGRASVRTGPRVGKG
jgi:hypothetical protein